MAQAEIRDKKICLLSIIFEVAKRRDQLWKTVRLASALTPTKEMTIVQVPKNAAVVDVGMFA